jgi:ribosomal protein L11 methylase PrmA
VARAVREAAPRAVRDLGCNTGDYAAVALEAGAGQVVGAKADAPTAHLAFVRAQRERPHHRSPHARALLAANARIVGSHAVSASGRVLFVYDRRP